MGINEQDAEVGRLVREKKAKEKELACLQSKRDRFATDIAHHYGKILRPIQEIRDVGNKTLSIDNDVKIEWIDADEMVLMSSDIRRLGGEISQMESKLIQMSVG